MKGYRKGEICLSERKEFLHPCARFFPTSVFITSAAQSHGCSDSGSTLYSREAPVRIHEAVPEARIIVMLRNPVDMIYALHNEHFTNGIEKYRSFEDALGAEERRACRADLVPRHVSPELFLYRKIGTYSPQISRYLDNFPREQIHFIFFEDFVRDIAAEYEQTLRFLEVDSAYQPEFRRINESRHVRNRTLQRLLLARPAWLQKAARALSPTALRHRLLNLASSSMLRSRAVQHSTRRLGDSSWPTSNRTSES